MIADRGRERERGRGGRERGERGRERRGGRERGERGREIPTDSIEKLYNSLTVFLSINAQVTDAFLKLYVLGTTYRTFMLHGKFVFILIINFWFSNVYYSIVKRIILV